MNSSENINCIEEDEIDLRELFDTILRYKKFIAIFVAVVVFITLIAVILKPNSYKSSIILKPQGKQKNIGGGLSSLASLAGVSIGGGDGGDPYTLMKSVLDDNKFHEKVIKKYDLAKKLANPQHVVYPFGLELDDSEEVDDDIFSTIKTLKSILSISQDKKSSLITLSATSIDRYFADELVQLYLKEIIEKIKENDLKEMKQQIHYYKKELAKTTDVFLKEQLSKSLSALVQKEVFSNANEFYIVSKVTDSYVAYPKDKTKPKRALILIVSMITALILAIFIVFFIEFLKNSNEEKSTNS